MVRLIVTERIAEAIAAINDSKTAPETLRADIAALDIDDAPKTIPHALLCHVSKTLLEETSDPKYHLHTLLRGSSFHLNVPKPRTKSPALLKLLEEAQLKLDEQAYEEMTRSISQKHLQTNRTSLAQDLKHANRAITAMVNVVFSMIAVFTALFYFGHTVTNDVAMRTLLSLFGALVVGIAEGWFFSKDLIKGDF
ncbi:hypothetical protein HDV00_002369 [Rhizophlyctis rosea]|nr:hypothetical protein HDV00_002369 [Rhizophlyctis rosea]